MELDELYQDILLDHFKHPRNYGPLPDAEVLVDELNPTCGDHIRLAARLESGRVAEVRFDGKGCAISLASASMMSELMRGLTPQEARARAADFVAFMRGEKELDEESLGDLAALAGVRQFPLRIKCATMSWHALEKALGKLRA
ncbi:MAG: SUF system NifU family Fe-S cluster assembly protein [Kiritimatiellae bacterium]|nr:SUF system NifU family Fe-S cluster assembly protein [Kiritimatiellia bacterium]